MSLRCTSVALIKPSVWHRSVDGIEVVLAREAKGLTQQQVAELCGCSQQFIQQIETPGTHEIAVEFARALAQAVAADYK